MNNNSGMTLSGVLLVVFVVLKLVGVINWSWIWVLSPLWISWMIVGLILLRCLCFLIALT
jgi:hypothetical protein